jgi:hypothetical protein
LITAAGHQFELDIPDKRGVALRVSIEKNLDRVETRLDRGIARPDDEADFAKMHADIAGPAFPEGSEYLYYWFCSLAAGRSSNGYGPNALTAVEIAAWCQVSGHRLMPWEFELIRALDHKWLEIYCELHKPDEKPSAAQN